MKEPWQCVFDAAEPRVFHANDHSVYNVKRKIASLPPISYEAYTSKVQVKEDIRQNPEGSSASGDDHGDSDEASYDLATAFQCLFCNQEFEEDGQGFEGNLDHMSTTHGLHIPDVESVEDLESLVGYLSTEVRVWHECLYCGATKPTTQSIQSHMRDKSHCQLNLDREPELLEFWTQVPSSSEEDEEGRKQYKDDKEMRLASGRVVGSRRAGPARKTQRKRNMALVAREPSPPKDESEARPTATGAQSSTGRQIARRDQMGIIGVSDQQRQALMLAEKKAQRSEAVARRAREWANNRGGNFQKHDQIDTTGFKGKQNHKLMPR